MSSGSPGPAFHLEKACNHITTRRRCSGGACVVEMIRFFLLQNRQGKRGRGFVTKRLRVPLCKPCAFARKTKQRDCQLSVPNNNEDDDDNNNNIRTHP